MTVTVPATAPASLYELYNKITTLGTQITNASPNGALVFEFTKLKARAQMDLVLSLLGGGFILASNVLANETYAVPTQPGGDQL